MFPFSTRNDVADGGFGHPKNHRQPHKAYLFLGMQKAHFFYLGFIQLCVSIFAAIKRWKFVPLCAALFYHVMSVFFWSARKKVRGIAAWGIIASVKNPKSFRNWSIGKLIGYSMGLVRPSKHVENSVPEMPPSFLVRPASIWPTGAIDFIPNADYFVFAHNKNARQLESKVRSQGAAIESTGAENRFMAFLMATLMPRKSYTNRFIWSTFQIA